MAAPSSSLPEPVPPALVPGLDALAHWRHELLRQWQELVRLLLDHDLLTAGSAETAEGVRVRLLRDKLVLALVAEYSRGKSELINAIFFGDAGRRIVPATPGRTTMCPVELAWDEGFPTSLDLLPIESRIKTAPLAELRHQRASWKRIALDPQDLGTLADAMYEVTRTKRVRPKEAESFGLWSMAEGEDLRKIGEDGMVDVPAWRHAIINYPHPLLRRGLVVIDTPGLNAIGAEPELTLSVLPSAHAALFVLGADTGVTRSDLAVWQDHLNGQAANCFIVLNKLDALDDPLIPPDEIERQVERQAQFSADILGVPRERVFPVSARGALAARMRGDDVALQRSRLPALEAALGADLLQRRQQVLAEAVTTGARQLTGQAVLRVRELRRHNAEQMLELRGLRGKSSGKIRQMLHRVEQEAAEFEQSGQRIAALRAVHTRMVREAVQRLSRERLREDIGELRNAVNESWLKLGARRSFAKLCAKVRERMAEAETQAGEIATMLEASYRQLNTEYGFTLMVAPRPLLGEARAELDEIERGYSRYTGLSQLLKMQTGRFVERLHRMLITRVRAVLDNASGEIELWSNGASAQLDAQLRERRRNFKRRHDALERIQTATDDLERRLAEVEAADQLLHSLLLRANALADDLCGLASRGPVARGPAAARPSEPARAPAVQGAADREGQSAVQKADQ